MPGPLLPLFFDRESRSSLRDPFRDEPFDLTEAERFRDPTSDLRDAFRDDRPERLDLDLPDLPVRVERTGESLLLLLLELLELLLLGELPLLAELLLLTLLALAVRGGVGGAETFCSSANEVLRPVRPRPLPKALGSPPRLERLDW